MCSPGPPAAQQARAATREDASVRGKTGSTGRRAWRQLAWYHGIASGAVAPLEQNTLEAAAQLEMLAAVAYWVG